MQPILMQRSDYEGIIAAIALVSLVGIGLSLSIPLLSLEMERMGTSGSEIGLNTAVAGLASILCIPFVPGLAARVGIGRLIGASILITAVSFLGFRLFFSYLAWFPIRFVFSAALGTLFVLSEYWISALAPPQKRGVIMGLYGTSLSLGFAGGPALLALTGTSGWPPYVASAALYALAIVPLALAWNRLPQLNDAPQHSIARYLFAVPLATGAGFGFGAIETGAFSMLPVLGLRAGLDAATTPLLVSAMALGNVMFQLPIGMLADRIDKARVLMCIAGFGVLGALMIAPTASLVQGQMGLWPLLSLLFVWGGIIGGIYVVGLSHLAAHYSGPEMASANAAFVLLYNVGLLVGPPIAGYGLDAGQNFGFSLAIASFAAVIVMAGLVRR